MIHSIDKVVIITTIEGDSMKTMFQVNDKPKSTVVSYISPEMKEYMVSSRENYEKAISGMFNDNKRRLMKQVRYELDKEEE